MLLAALGAQEALRLLEVGEGIAAAGLLEIKQGALAGRVADFVHGGGIVEAAVEHGVGDVLALADVFEGVAVDDDEVSQLAGLDAAELVVHAEVDGAVDGGAAQCLKVGHAALGQHPELPMCA